MSRFNFLENYDSLKIWENKISNLPIDSTAKNKYLDISKINVSIIKNSIKDNKFFLIPPLSILGMTLIIFFLSILPKLNIWRLTNKSISFDNNYLELENNNNQIESTANEIKTYIPSFNIKSPVLLFSYFLQSSIPDEVTILDYSLNNQFFVINASSNNIEKINIFINLINQMPIIERNSLEVKKLVNSSTQQNNASSQQTTNLGNINLEIRGNLAIISIEERLKYLKEIYNFGEARKLEQLLNLINTFKL